MTATRQWEATRRALAEFLAVPTAIIAGFLMLAAGGYTLDRARVTWLRPLRDGLQTRLFADTEATADLLAVIAGSLITVTSITISLLLFALHQSAVSLSSEVFDQFLRRRHNQVYFGCFVGLALYALITLATVNAPFNPVFGAALALLLTVAALFLLIVLLYTTINQMRPVAIIDTIHDYTLAARERQLHLLGRTRRAASFRGAASVLARTTRHGYVTGIDVGTLDRGIGDARGAVEIVLRVSIGSYVATGDVLAQVEADRHDDGDALATLVRGAVRLERQRDITADAANGIEELETITWTSISTAHSNPAPGLLTIRSLRDLLARWSDGEPAGASGAGASEGSARPGLAARLPIVYTDTVPGQLMDAFESLAVVSSESMQHQAFTEIVRPFAVTFERLPPDQRLRAVDIIRRMLAALGHHVLTSNLENGLADLARVRAGAGHAAAAADVDRARERLARTVGLLHSRSTRATPNG